jgi:hypothetical protein
MHPAKRWRATADLAPTGWIVGSVSPVGPLDGFVADLFTGGPLLAGFDFPIGLPAAYARRIGFPSFKIALEAFGTGFWSEFYQVAERESEIGLTRPFYPQRSIGGARRQHLVAAHGLAHFDDLLRLCERRTTERRAGCPLFWTLGGNQVGKAAASGWQELIRPAVRRGAWLWPFDGTLHDLMDKSGADRAGPVIAETYPAEAYGHVGIRVRAKRSQAHRATHAGSLLAWAGRRGVVFAPTIEHALRDGFGPRAEGEDAFDALIGLLGMIEVVAGERPEGACPNPTVQAWEGWILGLAADRIPPG